MKKKYYWKVVCNFNGGLFSLSKITGEIVDYSKFNTWIYPRTLENQFLFVFTTRAFARKFVSLSNFKDDLRILKVECQGVNEQRYDRYGDIKNTFNYPEGTMFCDSLRVIGYQ